MQTQLIQISIETKNKKKLDIINNENKKVIKQVWVIIATLKVVEDLKSCQSKIIIYTKDKDIEKAIQIAKCHWLNSVTNY